MSAGLEGLDVANGGGESGSRDHANTRYRLQPQTDLVGANLHANIRVDGSFYAARPAPIGSKVVVRIYTSTIEIRERSTQALLRIHSRATHAGSVILPHNERPFNPSRETSFLLARAGDVGPQTKALCQHPFESEGRVGQRAMWGIVGLARKYPARFVEQACDHALRSRICRYKLVRTLVERMFAEAVARFEQTPEPALPLTQEHPLIRPAAEYGDLFSLGAQHSANNDKQVAEPAENDSASRRARIVSATLASSDDASASTSLRGDARTTSIPSNGDTNV